MTRRTFNVTQAFMSEDCLVTMSMTTKVANSSSDKFSRLELRMTSRRKPEGRNKEHRNKYYDHFSLPCGTGRESVLVLSLPLISWLVRGLVLHFKGAIPKIKISGITRPRRSMTFFRCRPRDADKTQNAYLGRSALLQIFNTIISVTAVSLLYSATRRVSQTVVVVTRAQ